ncbi:phage holin family protein [Sutterella sp.]|uniref:phage holin family protein n=1 Tax=Sutterella sp. TaxID=1981025 RepID=UPI0026E0360D|nr:phage holin family protein [Sutterella sp.]MDO5531444.1 phage holin family protein [Sutterella sp.]
MAYRYLPTGYELYLAKVGAVLGALWGLALGKVEILVWWYLAVMVFDFVTGVWAACKNDVFSPEYFQHGLVKKFLVLAIICLARGLDVCLAFALFDFPVAQCAFLTAFMATDFASSTKNIEEAGYGDVLPPILKRLVASMPSRLEGVISTGLTRAGLPEQPQKESHHDEPSP